MQRTAFIVVAALALSGCAASPDAFTEVQGLLQPRTDARVRWKQGSRDDRAAEAQIESMLGRELRGDDAMQIALLNNPRLTARYEELGIAQADLVQAGLLKNPVFDGVVRWPNGAGGPNVELSVAADFLDVLFLPLRQRIARGQLQRTKLEVADAVLQLSAETREAFYQLQADQQMLELRRTVVEAEQRAAETARRLGTAGNISPLDADRERALAEQSRLELIDAELQARQSRQKLATLMGRPSGDWRTAPRLAEVPAPSAQLDSDELERAAERDRLDLAAAGAQVNALRQTLGLTRSTALVTGAEMGIDTERETGGQRVTGPTFRFPIPLFDFGQARLSAARHRLRQAEAQYQALGQRVQSEVQLAAQRMAAASQRYAHYREVILPLRQRIVEQSQLHYNGMLLGIFELLSAKQAQIEAGSAFVAVQRDYWIARAQLERAVGGRLSLPAATQPTTAPAKQPATPSSAPASAPDHSAHQHHH